MNVGITLDEQRPASRARSRYQAYRGFGLLLFVVIFAFLGPLLTSYSPVRADPLHTLLSPSHPHWFGTNDWGGDVFSRTVHAARLDLFIGIVSVGLGFLIGTPIGAAVGYHRGWVSGLTMRGMEFVQSFPVFILAMALVAVRGPGTWNVIAVIALLNIPIFARLVRAEVLSLRDRAFVEAGRSVGNGTARLVWKHILPNSLGSSIAQASASVGWALLLTAGLGFVGAGIRPPTPEWGTMIAEGAQNMITGQWWISLFPGLALGIAVLAFALAGDALRDLLDVRARTL